MRTLWNSCPCAHIRVDLSILLYLEGMLRDREEGVETRRGVVDCGLSEVFLRRIRPSHWFKFLGSGLG